MLLPGLIGRHVAFVDYDQVLLNQESICTSGFSFTVLQLPQWQHFSLDDNTFEGFCLLGYNAM
jgi:hypothetical protein